MSVMHGMKKQAFYHRLKSFKLIYYSLYIELIFSKLKLNAHSVKRMSYKTLVLRTLLDVRKTYDNERTLNTRNSMNTFIMR